MSQIVEGGIYKFVGGRFVEVVHVPEPAAPPTVPANRLIPVPEWNDFHPWPTERALRHYIFDRATNGFDACIVRRGRRVLIDEAKFFEWAKAQEKAS
jgi:hypothetical protein